MIYIHKPDKNEVEHVEQPNYFFQTQKQMKLTLELVVVDAELVILQE